MIVRESSYGPENSVVTVVSIDHEATSPASITLELHPTFFSLYWRAGDVTSADDLLDFVSDLVVSPTDVTLALPGRPLREYDWQTFEKEWLQRPDAPIGELEFLRIDGAEASLVWQYAPEQRHEDLRQKGLGLAPFVACMGGPDWGGVGRAKQAVEATAWNSQLVWDHSYILDHYLASWRDGETA